MMQETKPNDNLKPCKYCKKGVVNSVNKCSHCRATLKTRLFTKVITGLFIIFALALIFIPSDEEAKAKQDALLNQLAHSSASKLSPGGDLAKIFELESPHTDIQRDDLEKQINGLIIQWTLPVYEVQKTSKNIYQIQTIVGIYSVGTLITVHTRSAKEVKYIEGLKTGDMVKIKGIIGGVQLRHILISPAILVF